ncbi:hypothetical protein AB1L30_03930 [Bremerella sp. JC817]|uniref:hypothetical protein n=1 Tax=Bremerella sp. JC817 TaxID=3231756 RepID=UPI0034598425
MHLSKLILVAVCAVYLTGCEGEPLIELQPTSSSPAPAAASPSSSPAPRVPTANIDNNWQDVERVKQEVEKLERCGFEGNIETGLALTHPRCVEIVGGAAKHRQAVQQVVEVGRQNNARLETLDFPDPPTFVESDQHHFVVIAMHGVIDSDLGRIDINNYLVGCKEKDQTQWRFANAEFLKQVPIKRVFPDFPGGVKFPTTSVRPL